MLRQDMKRLRLWEEHKEAEVRTLTEQLAESAAAAQRLLRERVAQEQRAQRLELAVVPQLEASPAAADPGGWGVRECIVQQKIPKI